MTWIYQRSEPTLWTVGYYKPDGKWEPESDHGTPGEAGDRVHYLNGGCDRTCTPAAVTASENRLGADHD